MVIEKPARSTDDPRPQMVAQNGPWPDYSTREPLITELEDTVQLCCGCQDPMPVGWPYDNCANCNEEYEGDNADD